MVTSRAVPSHRTNYKARGPSSETQLLQVFKMLSQILQNQCNSVIFLLQHAIFFIHPVRIHVSLGCDRLSWHSSQKFASESANIIRRALFSVVALHFGRLCGYEKRIESVRMQRARGAGRSGCGKEVHHRPHHFLPRPPPSLRWYIRGRGCRARSLTPALVAVAPCRIVGRGRGRIRCLGRRGAFGACLSIRWQFQ
jgi:hypothetical protein